MKLLHHNGDIYMIQYDTVSFTDYCTRREYTASMACAVDTGVLSHCADDDTHVIPGRVYEALVELEVAS